VSPANIIQAFQQWPVEYLTLGATVDFEAALKGNRVWGRVKGDLIPLILDILRWKGKLSALPVLVDYEGLGINTELLKQRGLAMPKKDWTWDDYVEMGRKVAKPDEVWLGLQQFFGFNYWHASNLGYNTNREQTKITVDTPENIEALEFKVGQVRTRRLETDVASPPGAPSGNRYTWFGQGKQLTQVVNPGALVPPRYPGIPIEVTNFACGPNNKKKEISLGGGSYAYMVFKVKDPNKQRVAVDLALDGVTEQQQLENVRAGGNAPSSQAVIKSPALADAVRALAGKAVAAMDPVKYLTDYYSLAPHLHPLPTFSGWADALKIEADYMVKADKGEMTPRDALKEAQPRMQAILDRALS
jgi:multiple sugar transport system substrate-binding protein